MIETRNSRRGRALVRSACVMLSVLSAGESRAQTVPCDPAQRSAYGCWESIPGCPSDPACASGFPLREAIHMVMTYTGKVLLWDDDSPTGVVLWDPVTLAGTEYNNASDNLFCGGHAVLEDGRVFVAGGNVYPSECLPPHQYISGRKDAWIFDPNPTSPGWTEVPSMTFKRWYPTVTLLPDMKVLVTSGMYCGESVPGPVGTACTPEIFDPSMGTWMELTSASGDCRYTSDWYPWMHVLKNGKVLHAGPHRSVENKMQVLDPRPGQSWQDFGTSLVGGGVSVMYRAGNSATGAKAKILKTGHVHAISALAEIVDEDGVNASVASLNYARNFHQGVILPDGKVLVTGGSDAFNPTQADAVKQTELWNPDTPGTWTLLAPSPTDRMYHSTILLLPDGRLLSAGGEYSVPPPVYTIYNQNADFFSPPYLYKDNSPITDAQRPQVVGVTPAYIGTGSTFTVTVTPPAGTSLHATQGVTLIRPGAVTHSNNMDQRYMPLSFTSTPSGSDESLTITAPANLKDCQAGYYMLFFLNDDSGVLRPSKATFTRVWGIMEESVSVVVTQGCGSAKVRFTVEWDTSVETDGVDRVEAYVPWATCGVGQVAAFKEQAAPSGKHHQVILDVANPCAVGPWKLRIISTKGTSQSKTCKDAYNGTCLSCGPPCHPPCELE